MISINRFTLKIIAFWSMFIDHFALIVYTKMPDFEMDVYNVMRFFGRMAFPIYCFLLVEGFYYTKNVLGYISRLVIFAVISEPIFDFVIFGEWFHWEYQNVFFTLYTGLFLLVFLEYVANGFHGLSSFMVSFFFVTCLSNVANMSSFDYGFNGILCIAAFYFMSKVNRTGKIILLLMMSCVNIGTVLVAPLLYIYNNKPGRKMKYLFYVLYPAHIILLYFIRRIVI